MFACYNDGTGNKQKYFERRDGLMEMTMLTPNKRYALVFNGEQMFALGARMEQKRFYDRYG